MARALSKEKLTFIETGIAFIFLVFTFYFSKEHFEVSFSSMISIALYFMIYIELTRAIFDFILSDEHKFKVRYLYDMGIIFNIREILVTMTSKHHHIADELLFLGVSTGFLIILFILRVIDAKVFNYVNKCGDCVHSFKKKDKNK